MSQIMNQIMNHCRQLSDSESSQRSPQIASNLYERTQEGIAITDEKGLISYINKAAENILDVSFDKALGESIDRILALTPLSPSEPIAESHVNGHFIPTMLEGLFRLRRGKNTSIVSIKIAEMSNMEADGTERVFIIREIPDYFRLTPRVRSAASPVKISTRHEPPFNPELPKKQPEPSRFSLTYLSLRGCASESDPDPDVLNDCLEEATRIIGQLTSASGPLYQISKGESVMFMTETAQRSAIEVTLKLIGIIRAKFQLAGKGSFRLGLSAGILIMPSDFCKRDTTLMVEAARQLCIEAQEIGDNAIQIYDLNSHREGNIRGDRSAATE